MNANDLINDALLNGNKMLAGKDLYVLEANPEKNELRVVNLDEMYINNLLAFTYSINHGFLPVGIFSTKEAAEEMIITFRTLFRDENGNPLFK